MGFHRPSQAERKMCGAIVQGAKTALVQQQRCMRSKDPSKWSKHGFTSSKVMDYVLDHMAISSGNERWLTSCKVANATGRELHTGLRRSSGTEKEPLMDGDTMTADESTPMPRPLHMSSSSSSRGVVLDGKSQPYNTYLLVTRIRLFDFQATLRRTNDFVPCVSVWGLMMLEIRRHTQDTTTSESAIYERPARGTTNREDRRRQGGTQGTDRDHDAQRTFVVRLQRCTYVLRIHEPCIPILIFHHEQGYSKMGWCTQQRHTWVAKPRASFQRRGVGVQIRPNNSLLH